MGSTLGTTVAMLTAGLVCSVASAQAQNVPGADLRVNHTPMPEQLIVKFAPGAAPPRALFARDAKARTGAGRTARVKSIAPTKLKSNLADTLVRSGVTQLRPLHETEPLNAESAARHGMQRTFVLELAAGSDPGAAVAALTDLGGQVESVELDVWGQIAQLIPNDPLFCDQYGLHNPGQVCSGAQFGTPDADIDAPEAWNIHTGDLGTVVVAIVDSGVDPHPEYAARMVPGWNFAQDNSDTSDGCRHGTHVAGIVAASGNNALGVAGVTWGASIMPIRVFAGALPCQGPASPVAQGIRWAVDNGADICNISLQFPSSTSAFLDAVNYAHDSGVLVISAAGNQGSPAISYPARYNNSMAIGATDGNDVRAWFSNYGAQLDVVAPGSSILSTWTNDLCVGGTNPGAVCSSASDCLGVCQGGLDDGSVCWSGVQCLGVCQGGVNDGRYCTAPSQCPGVCQGGSRDGLGCSSPNDCPDGSCTGGNCTGGNCNGGNCTGQESGYHYLNGTSMATPMVSGVAALMKSYNPALTAREIWDILTCTADDRGATGWDQLYGHGRVNAHQAVVAAASVPRICTGSLPNDAIDARQPRTPDDPADQGWSWVDLDFIGDTSALTPADFTVTQEGVVGAPPFALVVKPSPPPLDGSVRVILSRAITPKAWTTVTHTASGTSISLGFLPGDSDGNGIAEEIDLQVLFDALNGVSDPPIWTIDIDRSGKLAPADILRLIDLLNGGGPYEPYLGTFLPL